MDTLFNYFPLDVQLEILKYNSQFRTLNKTYHKEGLTIFKETYGNDPVSINEYIKNINENPSCVFLWYNHNFSIKIIHKLNNVNIVNEYNIMFNPQAIDPGHFNNNVLLECKNHACYYTDKQLYNHLTRENYVLNLNLDINTTYDILQKRNLYNIDKQNIIENTIIKDNDCNDFDKMYIKICNIIFLNGSHMNNIKYILDKQFKFRFGKIIERKDEYLEYIQYLDNVLLELYKLY